MPCKKHPNAKTVEAEDGSLLSCPGCLSEWAIKKTTLDELTQGFINDLTAANVEDKKNVVKVWEKRFEEAGYGPLEWNGRGWSMNGGNRTVVERTAN